MKKTCDVNDEDLILIREQQSFNMWSIKACDVLTFCLNYDDIKAYKNYSFWDFEFFLIKEGRSLDSNELDDYHTNGWRDSAQYILDSKS